ncbi:unnamed protein product [Notodromas monacha]|uniref:non-specific serine/threonine protein kinase n=1 Tax=Notodromas monacha TaxID=399045 RepID=A0A7R9GEJ2_9CRUS|nr:unnamed protein product [Notodromas monacha]CAG0919794.1 unnamed protein product [Notodromas monacha]
MNSASFTPPRSPRLFGGSSAGSHKSSSNKAHHALTTSASSPLLHPPSLLPTSVLGEALKLALLPVQLDDPKLSPTLHHRLSPVPPHDQHASSTKRRSNNKSPLSHTVSEGILCNKWMLADALDKLAEANSVSAAVRWPTSPDDYELQEVIGVGATAAVQEAFCKPRKEKCAIKRINLDKWNTTMEELLKEIQAMSMCVGATAAVQEAFCKPRKEKCAIKRINLDKWNTTMEELLKEIQAMSMCHHENVVTYFTSFVVGEELWLILRLMGSGSLLDIIRYRVKATDCKHGVFDEATIATVLREVLKGLEYFHNNGQIHRDIKAGNVLIGIDGSVQIADFGVSAWLATGGDLSRTKSRHTFVGTPCWMAPEVMEQVTGYDYKADIWSLGITAIELATGTAPYHKYPPMKVLMLTLQNDPPVLESGTDDKEQYKHYSTLLRKFIAACLQKDPTKRPSATDLLKHPFILRKSKDKAYLQLTLLGSAPNLEERVVGVYSQNQRPPTSARVHRKEDNTWEWSSDDDDVERAVNGKGSGDGDERERVVNNDVNESRNNERGVIGTNSDSAKKNNVGVDNGVLLPVVTAPEHDLLSSVDECKVQIRTEEQDKCNNAEERSGDLKANISCVNEGSQEKRTIPSGKNELISSTKSPVNGASSGTLDGIFEETAPISLVLRMRNSHGELNDIRFEFQLGKDTAPGIASELVGAGLVNPQDMASVITSLDNILLQYMTAKCALLSEGVVTASNNSLLPAIGVSFPLNSCMIRGDPMDEKTLLGFALLTIGD